MMKHRYTTILAALICGTTASADVTAQQVWDNWKEQTAIYGDGFTVGSEEMSGDTLTVTDVQINIEDEEATVTSTIGTILLTENGDGTVSISMAESYPMTIAMTPQYGDPATINLTISQSDMKLDVSGDPEAMVYDVTAASYAINVDSIEGDGAEEIDLERAAVTLSDIVGRYSVATNELTEVEYAFSTGNLNIDFLMREVGGAGVVMALADLSDLSMFANISLPADMDLNAPEPPFEDGLALNGGYTFGAVNYEFEIDADGEAASGTASVDGGTLGISFDYDGVSYTGESRGIDVSLLVPNEIPFPLEASLGQYGFDFIIPLSQGEGEPRDARLAFNITDLAVSDTIWNLADPANVLPRDPLTIALGIDAEVSPFFDFLDPEQADAAMMSDVPGELNSAEITNLVIRGGGAEITGDGAFTFDNSDLQTFDGLPRPEGQVNFAINGVNGLVDKLIQMGLIPEEEAMMPRMMLGMFATPVGDDMLTSTIEVNSEGHVLANGQRLR